MFVVWTQSFHLYKYKVCGVKDFGHSSSKKLQWLSEDGEIKVITQVLLNFFIRKYKDEVLCDVVPIEACHVLLGRPWKYDRHVYHDDIKRQ